MRALWTGLAAVVVVGVLPANAPAWQQYDVPDILKSYRPMQQGVEYDTPSDPNEIAACQAEVLYEERTVDGERKRVGYGVAIRDGQGRILRRFLNTSGQGSIDQWSYYKDGFEVYRDVDYNDDRKIDESRWLNTGGTRIAVVEQPGNRIASWRRISAEEASKVFVQGLVAGDLNLLGTVIAAPKELEDLGLPQGLIDEANAALDDRKAQVEALSKQLTGWNRETSWLRFDGVLPHVIPADATKDLKDDVLLYENVTIYVTQPDGQTDLSRLASLQVPEMVKIGENWKFVGLPRALTFDPSEPTVIAAFDGIRSWVYREAGSVVSPTNTAMEAALTELADYDVQAMDQVANGSLKDVVNYHFGRIQQLRKVVEAAAPNERLVYEKEIVNSLAAAYQTGEYEAGKQGLDSLIADGGPLASYAAFRKILAEYTLRAEDSDKVVDAQKQWIADLENFLKTYPKSEDTPDALLQLASVHEFNGDEDEARTYYDRLSREFPHSEAGQKATGALKRLDLVGKPLALTGTTVEGEAVDATSFEGKPVLVVFYTSTAGPFRRDLPELNRVYQKHKADGFEIIGVSLDNDRETLDRFLQEQSVPWPTIFEPGGMEGRLGNEYGIISLPTMILADADGQVVNRNLRSAVEVENQLDTSLAQKP